MVNRLKEIRKKRGLTQRELSRELNISNRTLINWEQGSNPKLTPDLIRAISRELQIEVSEVFALFVSNNDN
jgi:transcriptional regulator with XRE-family HTH domain